MRNKEKEVEQQRNEKRREREKSRNEMRTYEKLTMRNEETLRETKGS